MLHIRTEKILVREGHPEYKQYRNVCKISTAIYNCANYYIRQNFFNGEFEVNWQSADKYVRQKYNSLYNSLPNQSAQSIIRKLGDDWNSFYMSNKAYKLDSSKFNSKPKPPKYKKGLGIFISSFQSMSVKNGKIHFPKKMNLNPLSIHCCDNQTTKAKGLDKVVTEIRILPQNNAFYIEVVYNKEINNDILLDKSNVLGIDLGLNNLLTITTNQNDLQPLLINGKVIKSINHFYNKSKAYYQSNGNHNMINRIGLSRHLSIKDYFHKVSNFVKEYCLKHNIGKVVIGNNKQWKDKINMGKVNNQNFVSVPFGLLIKLITYKCEEYGIEVILQEESYTSKSDALACDILPIYNEANTIEYQFKGKRKSRGLYQSSKGLLNADVNGSLNILRKVIGDGFIRNLINSGCVFQPVRVNL